MTRWEIQVPGSPSPAFGRLCFSVVVENIFFSHTIHLNHIFPSFQSSQVHPVLLSPKPLLLHFPTFKVLFDWLFLLYFCNWLPKVFCAHVHWSTHVPILTHTSDTHNNNNTHKKTSIIFSQDAPHAMWMPQLVNYICIFGCLEQSSVHKKWSGECRASTHSPPWTQAQLPFHHHPVGDVYLHQSMNRQSPCFTSSLALGLYSTDFGKSIMTCNYSYGISQNTCTAPNQMVLASKHSKNTFKGKFWGWPELLFIPQVDDGKSKSTLSPNHHFGGC